MIPKIAHFHWTGGPFSWLRTVSIASFKKFNPSWEIRLHDTAPDVKGRNLRYCQEADLMSWLMLTRHGGFKFDTDIVFIRSIPEEWNYRSLNACIKDGNFVHIAAVGASASHPLFVSISSRCLLMSAENLSTRDQAFGTDILRAVSGSDMNHGNGLFNQPSASICPVSPFAAHQLWEDRLPDRFPDNVLGVHWYGGHPVSKEKEMDARPGHLSSIVRLAESVFP